MDRTENFFNLRFRIPNLLKMGLFGTVFATSQSNPESRMPTPRQENIDHTIDHTMGLSTCEDPIQARTCGYSMSESCGAKYSYGSGDRGKTGAGVTGSRTSRVSDKTDEVLPAGATNPGLLRYLHNAARYRMPQCFEGACVSVRQGANSNWILGHALSFSSVSPGGYKFLLSYIDKEKPSALPYFVMEAAPGGHMSCEIRIGPSQGTRATVVAQVANTELYSFETVFDSYFKKSTASVIAVNREFIALHYLQVGILYLFLFS